MSDKFIKFPEHLLDTPSTTDRTMSPNIVKFPSTAGVRDTSDTAHQPEGALQPPGNVRWGANPSQVPEDERTGAFLTTADGTVVSLTADQHKALNCIVSGMPFVFIGIKPSDRGASFYRAAHGDEADLRNAHDHLADQINKLFASKSLLPPGPWSSR